MNTPSDYKVKKALTFEVGNDSIITTSDDNPVNNPSHYQSYVKDLDIDCITAMRAAFGDEEVKAFCKANAMKYIWRSSSKGQNESIKKAIWYLNKFLELGGYE